MIRYLFAIAAAFAFVLLWKCWPDLGFLWGWWGCCAWLLISKQWRPFA